MLSTNSTTFRAGERKRRCSVSEVPSVVFMGIPPIEFPSPSPANWLVTPPGQHRDRIVPTLGLEEISHLQRARRSGLERQLPGWPRPIPPGIARPYDERSPSGAPRETGLLPGRLRILRLLHSLQVR